MCQASELAVIIHRTADLTSGTFFAAKQRELIVWALFHHGCCHMAHVSVRGSGLEPRFTIRLKNEPNSSYEILEGVVCFPEQFEKKLKEGKYDASK
jgi:hypothetical protein